MANQEPVLNCDNWISIKLYSSQNILKAVKDDESGSKLLLSYVNTCIGDEMAERETKIEPNNKTVVIMN